MSYPFVLSQRSIFQGRDMFLFCLLEYPIAIMGGGWNLKHNGMTIKTFYRWLDIIDDHYGDRPNFELRKINLKRVDLLRYVVDDTTPVDGPPLPRDSVDPLLPGVYGPFLGDRPYMGQVGHRDRRSTFLEREMQAQNGVPGLPAEPFVLLHNEMSQDIVDAATRRDQGVCCITGRAATRIVWVIPPYLGCELDQQSGTLSFQTVENTITLCTELTGPFAENIFSVDVEDDSRIVTFQSLPKALPLLPRPRLGAVARFWNLHFKWTLDVHFTGGDVSLEPPDPHPVLLMEELAEGDVDLTEPKWQSGAGAEVLEEYMMRQASGSVEFDGDDAGAFDEDDDGHLTPNSDQSPS
ncbi:hypothetical protein DFH07DRAFT_841397 [Mycena maculata]|uniref:Uncharacterized protein n=1 Tax=Mycena maculata TaxID=230809 RepID=A0AAD7MYQ8_9AGAR|nr:hypothetical protein DFH07DRAFT_841397 [Mycena maculata]